MADSQHRYAKVFVTTQEGPCFAEQERGLHADRPSVGLCFSGGGTRSLSACWGYYRGLTELGLMDNVRVITSVSGGTWASFIYTYYCAGASNDVELLGPSTAPQDITMKGLRRDLPRCAMGWVATQSVRDVLLEEAPCDPADELWDRAIGTVILGPFGLYHPDHPRTISLDGETVKEIIGRQPEGSDLCADDFVTARKGRPFLVSNASLLAPRPIGTVKSESPVVQEYTPLYVGSPQPLSVTYHPRKGDAVVRKVGGGYVEPFAAGGEGPATIGDSDLVELQAPTRPFTTSFMVGTSSAAPAGALEELPAFKKLRNLDPQAPYWPVRRGDVPATETWEFGDGGVLDNYGIISMVLRGLETIVVFNNTETPLNLDYDPTTTPTSKDIDSYLPPLFGIEDPSTGTFTQNNRVFTKKDYVTVVKALQEAKRKGGATIAVTELTTCHNPWWGVKEGQAVRICWVYLDRVPQWEHKIGDRWVRWNIRRGNCWLPTGPFRHFPHYKTVDEDFLELVELTSAQVRLLADLCCFTVTSNAKLFCDLLGAE